MARMIDCGEAMKLLHDYLKQDLTEELAVQVRHHLEACRPCHGHAKFEQNYLEMLRAKVRSQCCPGATRARILDALRAETRPEA